MQQASLLKYLAGYPEPLQAQVRALIEGDRLGTLLESKYPREPEYDKAFYQLCTYMAPDYHQLELDMRLCLTYRDTRHAPPSSK